MLPVPGIYRHYKGQRYQLLGQVRHSETGEPLALYRALYGGHDLWVRPAAMFVETVQVDDRSVPRFALERAEPSPLDTHRNAP